ncbi:MAG: 4Fe-4S binding protein [Promethearchaeota archaeon]
MALNVLLLYWSGTGQTAKIVDEFINGFSSLGMKINIEKIRVKLKKSGYILNTKYNSIEFHSEISNYADSNKKGIDDIKGNHDKRERDISSDSKIRFSLNDYDMIGIFSPTYAFRAPRVFTRFLKDLQSIYYNVQNPFFIVISSGGEPANAAWSIYKIFKLHKSSIWPFTPFLGYLEVSGMTNLRSWMPKKSKFVLNNEGTKERFTNEYMGLDMGDLKLAHDFPALLLKRFQQMKHYKQTEAASTKADLKDINSIIQRKHFNDDTLDFIKPPHRDWKFSIFTTFLTYRFMMRTTAGKKYVDPNKCTKCGLCAKVICPMGAISLKDGYPSFDENRCTGCQGCLNLCPEDAIYSRSSKDHIRFNTYFKYIIKYDLGAELRKMP